MENALDGVSEILTDFSFKLDENLKLEPSFSMSSEEYFQIFRCGRGAHEPDVDYMIDGAMILLDMSEFNIYKNQRNVRLCRHCQSLYAEKLNVPTL